MTDTMETPIGEEMEAIKKELPEKDGEFRRILPLFKRYYRVNFHHEETNVITRSYFVQVNAGKVTY